MLGRGVEVEQFTYDGKTPAKSSTNDPTSIQAKEWQIWLYSAVADTGAPNHWGEIVADSYDEAVVN